MNEDRRITSKIRLSDFFFRSDIVQKNDNYDSFTRGMLTQRSQSQDQFFTEEVGTKRQRGIHSLGKNKINVLKKKKTYYTRIVLSLFLFAQVSEFLFRIPNKTEGTDLVSLDLERGRDFGLPPYNKFRQLCGLSQATTFDDFTDQISKKVSISV